MNYPELITMVSERSGLPRAEAQAITRATLQTLGERITGGEARGLAVQLPTELRDVLEQSSEEAEPLDLDEFLRQVGERAGVMPVEASDGIAAVFQTMEDAVRFGEFDKVMSRLPEEFGAWAKPILLP